MFGRRLRSSAIETDPPKPDRRASLRNEMHQAVIDWSRKANRAACSGDDDRARAYRQLAGAAILIERSLTS